MPINVPAHPEPGAPWVGLRLWGDVPDGEPHWYCFMCKQVCTPEHVLGQRRQRGVSWARQDGYTPGSDLERECMARAGQHLNAYLALPSHIDNSGMPFVADSSVPHSSVPHSSVPHSTADGGLPEWAPNGGAVSAGPPPGMPHGAAWAMLEQRVAELEQRLAALECAPPNYFIGTGPPTALAPSGASHSAAASASPSASALSDGWSLASPLQ